MRLIVDLQRNVGAEKGWGWGWGGGGRDTRLDEGRTKVDKG